MFFIGKKIVYLNCYEKDEKGAAAGFARLTGNGQSCRVEINLRKVPWPEGSCQVVLKGCRDIILPESLMLRQGEGRFSYHLQTDGKETGLSDDGKDGDALWGIEILRDAEHKIKGQWKKEPEAVPVTEMGTKPEPEERIDALPGSQEEIILQQVPQQEIHAEEHMQHIQTAGQLSKISEDKWVQLQKIYTVVHPFKDERLFLSIEPKDFIILQSSYQKLVNNSFLLHGFYNYRHIILGPGSGVGTDAEDSFYLGVPGTFYEREKMVAVMFGFEGFECSGQVENGKFGYYMRRVEL